MRGPLARWPRPPAGYFGRAARAGAVREGAARRAELRGDGPGMATVREKAAALSLGAACSPAVRPTGTGRLRGGRVAVRRLGWLGAAAGGAV